MKKLLAICLIVVMMLPVSVAYAAYDKYFMDFEYEDFKNAEPVQNGSDIDWIPFNTWDAAWTLSNYANSGTYLEPAARGTGTAMRMRTDGSKAYSTSYNTVFILRPTDFPPASGGQVWMKFDWMVEDHNASHEIRGYTYNVQGTFLQIGTDGVLKAGGTSTGIDIPAKEWHTYEICFANGTRILYYLDGTLIHSETRTYNTTLRQFMFLEILQNDGTGMIKPTAMQIDNLQYTRPDVALDLREKGIKDESFSVAADGSSITFTATPYNMTASAESYIMILGVYDETGKYVKFNYLPDTVAAGDAGTTPKSVTVDTWGTGYTAKLHILKSWTDRTGFINNVLTFAE